MKAYGIPRSPDAEYPDLVDAKTYAVKSSLVNTKSKSGNVRNSSKNSQTKRNTRRLWKKKERANGKRQCLDYRI